MLFAKLSHFSSFTVMVFMLSQRNRSVHADVSHSSAEIRELVESEEAFLDYLERYISEERTKLEQLDEYRQHLVELRANDTLTNHPISQLHVLNRFLSTTAWDDIYTILSDNSLYNEMTNEYNRVRDHTPTESDYNEANGAIIRLQQTYELIIPDLLSGNIYGRHAKPLSQDDAKNLAIKAVNNGEVEAGIKWMEHAQNHLEPPLVLPEDIYHFFSWAYAAKGERLKAVEFAYKALEINPDKDVLETLSTSVFEPPERTQDELQYSKLCRASLVESVHKRNLNCQLKRNKYNHYELFKIEYLNHSPDIIMFHKFVTDKEVDILKSEVMDVLLPAGVRAKNENDSYNTDKRFGKTGWLYDSSNNTLIAKISKRIGDATELNVTNPTGEPLQVANYGIGGHYLPHFDCHIDTPSDVDELNEYNRLATVMLYLNDVELGGSTVFPRLNLAIHPVKNSAVLWFNYGVDAYPDERTKHAGCPVLIGEKWIANKWIHAFGNELNRPCWVPEDDMETKLETLYYS